MLVRDVPFRENPVAPRLQLPASFGPFRVWLIAFGCGGFLIRITQIQLGMTTLCLHDIRPLGEFS
jgi:hypothetical protein